VDVLIYHEKLVENKELRVVDVYTYNSKGGYFEKVYTGKEYIPSKACILIIGGKNKHLFLV
jgi:hypothetical protein